MTLDARQGSVWFRDLRLQGLGRFRRSGSGGPWQDPAAIRSELFGTERLEHHAISLAVAQAVTRRGRRVLPLATRVADNSASLVSSYRACAEAVQARTPITPAAEWLLDNFHVVEQQLRQIADDLPPGYYRQLPKLADGPLAGYPRVLGIAWGYVAHTDSLVSGPVLVRFVRAYQTVAPLTIGELWAVAITLRIVLIENLRRVSDQITAGQDQRRIADALVDYLLAQARPPSGPPPAAGSSARRLSRAVARLDGAPLPPIVAAQIAKRLRVSDPAETPLRAWLDERLQQQGLTVEDVLLQAQHRQGASNVTMRNIITSMRLLSELDWEDFFEEVSLIEARLRRHPGHAAMDFASRNLYRTAVETLARGSTRTELQVTDTALALAEGGQSDRMRDPGHWLVSEGRAVLEGDIGFVADPALRLRRLIGHSGIAGYLALIGLAGVAILSLALVMAGARDWVAAGLALAGFGLALDAGMALVNMGVTRTVAPQRLPGLELAQGIPADQRTLVAVPVLLDSMAEMLGCIDRLEVHHLSSGDGALHYAILADLPDGVAQTAPHDAALIGAAQAGIARLNASYPSTGGERFLFLHRRRRWNAGMGLWMGWERKRGKLAELNRLLRGATDTNFAAPCAVPQDVRFVITLDADTRLPRDTVRRLIGKLAHPLNRPVFDPVLGRVTAGYGILQPRVTLSLPLGTEGSIFQRINAGHAGIDAYAAAISDVYQDLFGEGSFTGKGIYDVDAFEAAMAGRVPENTLLSHDLFEGNLARAGLVSDIEVVEDFPARTDVAARRQHRWVRGDWQLVPFLVGQHGGTMSALGRWKIIDNLRRSLTAPLTLVALVAGWFLPLPLAAGWTGAVLAMMALPHLLPLPFVLLPGRAGITARSHATALVADARDAAWQVVLAVVLLPDTAARMGDAILRTAWRLCRSHRNLLEWTTAAQISLGGRPSLAGLARAMAPGVGLGLVAAGAPLAANPTLWPLILPFAVLWLAAPAIAHRISRPEAEHRALPLTQAQAQDLRLIGRRTWRYFETFVTAADNFLPPDNFQETPVPVVARRTSPTNIGLYLLATTAARDMGWVGLSEAVERLEQTLATLQRMPRFRGHIHNWHATDDLHVMAPAYVSSVDSGNLAGHLIAVAQACAAWRVAAGEGDLRAGVRDAILLAVGAPDADLDPVLADRLAQLTAGVDRGAHLAALMRLADLAAARAVEMADEGSDLRQWVEAARSCLASHARDLGPTLAPRLAALERQARAVATGMDFAFLLDPEKKLLSIGFSVETNALDRNCYDLLASEARLASLFAIAKGDVETRHWFRLGRSATPLGAGSALISWSGSMFEYLMPSLVMRAPAGSLLEETNRRIVVRQQDYAKAVGIPWGISESAYNARDLEMTYQYSNFGVPGLGLKRGLSESRVVAPYATALAAMVDPAGALRNFARLAGLGAVGRFGFYDAVDFSVQRLPTGSTQAIVRSFMAHHQGMTIAAIANVLMDGRLRARFHAEPMIQAVDLLLHERVPRDASEAPPRARDVATAATEPLLPPAVRRFPNPAAAAETAHLLSNGSYGVVLTPTGAGYSRWRGMAVTRWRDDPTTAQHGAFILLSDRKSGALWSVGLQPTGAGPDRHRVMFCDHHAAFTHEGDRLTTHTEVVVSAEDDAEARRVTLTNSGRQPRRIDVTSYAELVLAPLAADIAHPAFSKLFVVTDHMPELGAIIATRRRRSPSDPEVWAAHVAVVEGVESGSFQFETDRARFLGRCGSIGCAAMAHGPLSNTAGTVLDPIFALRRSVIVPPGGVARVTFWTTVADTPEALLDLVDRHRDAPAFDRAEALSWTQSQVQLRHLGITSAAAADFQRLGGMVLRADPRLRAPRRQIEAGAGPQSGLWSMGISGDLPLVILRMNETEDMDALHQVVSAHAYWRARQLDVDLVILNDRASSYVQELQTAIDVAVRTAQATPRSDGHGGTMRGRIHVLRADLLSSETRGLLLAVARVVLTAGDGDIGRQIDGMAPVAAPLPRRPRHGPAAELPGDADDPPLEFFNGLGGFDKDGREYVTVLRDGQTTPAPWINVIANPGFGFQVSAEGGGFVWAENSRENQITPWSNDPITDPPGDAIYLHDLDSDALWTVTALPIRGQGRYTARHGFGYTRFDHRAHDIDAAMVQFVPPDDPVRITRLTLTNHGPRPRRISVTAYAEWVLGSSRGATLGHVITETDPASGAILARNTYATAFLGRIAFADFGAGTSSLTADRTEFLGHGGSMAAPAGIGATPLSGRTGPALDPCAALQRRLTLAPGETAEVVFLLGQAPSREAARDLIQRHRATDPEVTLAHVRHHWSDLLGTVQVTSPDRAMDILLNGWLLYQTLACRIWARAGFYQASGAYGFRDQLQDGMALTALRPEMTRAHLLRAASRQFAEGDVQHWWLPHSGQGVRTRISDDRVWLGYAVAQYVAVSGDAGVLDAQVPFLDGPALAPGVHDDFFLPGVSETSASLFEHCARGLDQAIALTGTNGMPLIGTGDWNDGMNRVGEGGAGTSVWLGWLLVATLNCMAPLADTRDPARAVRWRAHAASVTAAIEREGWDGAWYRRGTYDDGTPLGSARSDECRIDSIAQSWAVLSGAAAPARASEAMASMTEHLVRSDPGLALLFTPPFDRTDRDPGYIKGYPPGLRENGGQYSHAAMWAILAHCRLGNGDAAGALFALVNPINHALTPQDAARYKVEPYVVAADVYSSVLHDGRGGWTWYTGSAGWMYRAGIEGLLGLTRAGQTMTLDPCFPSGWPEVRMRLVHGGARLAITILNPGGSGYGVERADLDGADLPVADGRLTLTLPPPRASGDYRLTLALRPR